MSFVSQLSAYYFLKLSCYFSLITFKKNPTTLFWTPCCVTLCITSVNHSTLLNHPEVGEKRETIVFPNPVFWKSWAWSCTLMIPAVGVWGNKILTSIRPAWASEILSQKKPKSTTNPTAGVIHVILRTWKMAAEAQTSTLCVKGGGQGEEETGKVLWHPETFFTQSTVELAEESFLSAFVLI